jgi:hypothetical protein
MKHLPWAVWTRDARLSRDSLVTKRGSAWVWLSRMTASMTPRYTLMTRHHLCPKVCRGRFRPSCGRYLRRQEPEGPLQPAGDDLLMPVDRG